MNSLRKPTSANGAEALWDLAREAGLSRRQFFRLLSAGGALAVFGASAGSVARLARAQSTAGDVTATYQKNFVKDTTKNFYHLGATVAASYGMFKSLCVRYADEHRGIMRKILDIKWPSGLESLDLLMAARVCRP